MRFLLPVVFSLGFCLCCTDVVSAQPTNSRVEDKIRPISPDTVGGFFGQRLDLWREKRLWRVGRDSFLLEGFESPPGQHPWQGEHVGKWMHAATLACDATGDERLHRLLRDTVEHLVDAQHTNGYLGTYSPEMRFYNPADEKARWSWDIWTHRYLIYGLLVYDRFRRHPAAVDACIKMGDLLLDSFGPGQRDITQIGTRHGLSAVVLLESVMMLYERTGEARFLRFAEEIVERIERNPELRLARAMKSGLDVSIPGDGKAYQLMATLLGYGELYRHTGNRDYLQTALTAWEQIRRHHIYDTGGPWSLKSNAAKNDECFALPRFFHPTNCVETCSTTTWIQLSLLLWRITGEARFAAEADRALVNHLIGAQSPNGNDWAYFTMPNQTARGYKNEITCCASSGPRALEMCARHLAGSAGGRLVINSYYPMSVPIRNATGAPGTLVIEGDYPFAGTVTVRLDISDPVELTIDWLLPVGAESMEIGVGGERQSVQRTGAGYHRLTRTWKPNEKAKVSFEFPLRASFQTGRDGVRWVSFRRGPLVLAQDITRQVDEPQVVLSVSQETNNGAQWIDPEPVRTVRRRPNLQLLAEKGVVYRIKDARDVFLIPYSLAGNSGGGVRTMFPTVPAE